MTKAAGFLRDTSQRQFKELSVWGLQRACSGLRCKSVTTGLVLFGKLCTALVERLTSFVVGK